MRFLSPRLADLLESSGHQAVHVRNCGLQTATDAVLLQRAPDEGRTLISADIDCGALLARERETSPSVILLRSSTGRRAADVASVILADLDAVADDLHTGAVVVIGDDRCGCDASHSCRVELPDAVATVGPRVATRVATPLHSSPGRSRSAGRTTMT